MQKQSEGIRSTALITAPNLLKIIVLMFCAAGPLFAQSSLALRLPIRSESTEPISFMRAPYRIHPQVTLGTPNGFTPAQIRHAYGFDQVANQGAGQIIGIVDAYDDANAESDLAKFNAQYNLPACTSSNGCFRKIYGGSKRPVVNANWALEISLDVQWAHAIAPKATILLVESTTNSLADLLGGVDAAVRNGASVVSMSWTVGEFSSESRQDNHFISSGVTFLAASGDAGSGAAYPASSPDVVGVGGTTLNLDASGNYLSEVAWSGSGGGTSSYEREPLYQSLLGIPNDSRGYRGAPDVSYNANPATGFSVYDSVPLGTASGWFRVGGTSAGSPQWAAALAIANSIRVANRKAHLAGANTALYSLAKSNSGANFHPVNSGTNGTCGANCTAKAGYDYVTGVGTPIATTVITDLAAQ
jgi:subtilase family serine protease